MYKRSHVTRDVCRCGDVSILWVEFHNCLMTW